jgi:predicted GTPase
MFDDVKEMYKNKEQMRQKISETLERLEEMLEDAPDMGPVNDVVVEEAKKELRQMRRLIADKRPPRFAIVGRRGAGKSSLINAIFGEYVAEVGHEKAMTGKPEWWTYESDNGKIDILDTRGFQEGSEPDKETEADSAEASIKREISEQLPDAILFIVKATNIDSAIDGDLEALQDISDEISRKYGHPLPLIAVVTNCDVVEPKPTHLHKPAEMDDRDLNEKRKRIHQLESMLEQRIRDKTDLGDSLTQVHGVSAYMSWRDDGSIRADHRWNIGSLVQYMTEELPEEAQFEFARLARVKFVQQNMANRVTTAASTIAAGIAAVPSPVADIVPITTTQTSLVAIIAFLSGRELGTQAITEFMGAMGVNVAAGFGARELARALVQTIPVYGSAISAAIAYGTTYGLGRAATAYFIGDADKEEAQNIFNEQMEVGKQKYENKDSDTQ